MSFPLDYGDILLEKIKKQGCVVMFAIAQNKMPSKNWSLSPLNVLIETLLFFWKYSKTNHQVNLNILLSEKTLLYITRNTYANLLVRGIIVANGME